MEKKLKVNLRIEPSNLKMNDATINYVPTGVTSNEDGTEYMEINQYSVLFEKSVPTIRRRLRKIPNKDCYQYSLMLWGKYYISPLFDTLDKKEYSEKGSLKGNYYSYLNRFFWDYFGCVAFENELSVVTLKKRMESYFNLLVSKMKGIELRMFYVIEENPNRGGYHAHFILKIGDDSMIEKTLKISEKHFDGKGKKKYADLKMDPFISGKGGIEYILKDIDVVKDGYDLLVHNATA